MEDKKLIELAYCIVNDVIFKNTTVDNIILVIKYTYVFKDIDIDKFRIFLNISQRRKKLIELDEKKH